jgi:hypothetical protein
VSYSLGKSPIINEPTILKKPRLVMVDHPVYMWNETLIDNGINLIDVVETGDILLILSVNINSSDKYTDDSCDCYVFNQKGKFGWALINIDSIIYLDGDIYDFIP